MDKLSISIYRRVSVYQYVDQAMHHSRVRVGPFHFVGPYPHTTKWINAREWSNQYVELDYYK